MKRQNAGIERTQDSFSLLLVGKFLISVHSKFLVAFQWVGAGCRHVCGDFCVPGFVSRTSALQVRPAVYVKDLPLHSEAQ